MMQTQVMIEQVESEQVDPKDYGIHRIIILYHVKVAGRKDAAQIVFFGNDRDNLDLFVQGYFGNSTLEFAKPTYRMPHTGVYAATLVESGATKETLNLTNKSLWNPIKSKYLLSPRFGKVIGHEWKA